MQRNSANHSITFADYSDQLTDCEPGGCDAIWCGCDAIWCGCDAIWCGCNAL